MEKLYAMLGLARRANRLLIGRDSVMAAVRAGKARLVLLTADASPRHRQELAALEYTGKTAELNCTMDDMGFHLGKRSCIFALEDEHFIHALEQLI